MQFLRGALPALALALTLAPAYAQDPLQELRRYDYQDRVALDAIAKQIVAAGKDTAKLAALETGLVAVLSDPQATEAARLEACTFLCRIGTARSVPAVAKLLTSPATVNIACLALERNTDPSAGAALQAALGSAKGLALVGIVNSLGNRGEESAVSKLKGLTGSTEPLVAEAAVNALGKIGGLSAVAALRTIKSPALPVAPALLRAAGKLAAAGKPTDARGIYESLLRPEQPEVIRSGALTGLVAVGAPKLGERALGLARTAPEPQLQRVAGRVLGMQAESTKLALEAFPALPAPAQLALLTAWSERKEGRAAGIATQALKSSDPDVQAAAVQATARLGGAAVVPTLAELATGGPLAGVARDALARMGGAGVESALLAQASKGNTAVITLLGQRPTKTSQAALLAMTAQSDTKRAVAALKVLERTMTYPESASLVDLLVATKDESIRDAAQVTLVATVQRSGLREQASERLLPHLQTGTPEAKAAILGTLAELGGDRALGTLAMAASSTDETLRGAALTGLANTWSDSRALPTLLAVAKKSTGSDRIIALRGSLRLLAADDRMPAPQKLAQLTELFGLAERVEEKRQALSVLREVRLPVAAAMAAQSLDNPQLIAEATDAVLYLAAPQRKDRTNLPAVTGNEIRAALDKVLATTQDEKIREQARKLRG